MCIGTFHRALPVRLLPLQQGTHFADDHSSTRFHVYSCIKRKRRGRRSFGPSSRARRFHDRPAPVVWIGRSLAYQRKTYRLKEGTNRYTSPLYAPVVYFRNRTNMSAEGRGRKRWVPLPPSRRRLRSAGFGAFLFY